MNKFEKDFTALKQTVDQYKQRITTLRTIIKEQDKQIKLAEKVIFQDKILIKLQKETISGQAEEIDELKDELNDIFLKEKGIEKS